MKEDSISDIKEITCALEAVGFEVYAVEKELDYSPSVNDAGFHVAIPNGIIKIKVARLAKNA